MLLIQDILHFYNKYPFQLYLYIYIHGIYSKTTFNIDWTIIHSSLSIPFNFKNLPSMSLEWLDNLAKKYCYWRFYQVQLVHDAKILKTNTNDIDSLTSNFWMEKTNVIESSHVPKWWTNWT